MTQLTEERVREIAKEEAKGGREGCMMPIAVFLLFAFNFHTMLTHRHTVNGEAVGPARGVLLGAESSEEKAATARRWLLTRPDAQKPTMP